MSSKPGFEHRSSCRAARRNLMMGRCWPGNTRSDMREDIFLEAAMAQRDSIGTKRAKRDAAMGAPERLKARLEIAIRALTGEVPTHATIMHPKTRIADHGRPEERSAGS